MKKLLLIGMILFPVWGMGQLTIVLEDLPDNTPHDATFFLVGDFNHWNPGDPDFVFQLGADGKWFIELSPTPDSFDYKVTRGNWSSVEGRANGRHRPNRICIRKAAQERIGIQVYSWEDLAGGLINVYTFLLLLSAFQGLLLIFAINGIQDNNIAANRILSVLIFMISFALLGRVAIYDRDIFNWGPWLKRIPEMIFFFYGPLFFLYLRRLLKLDLPSLKERILYFGPGIVHLMAIIPSFFWERQELIDQAMALEIDLSTRFWGILALLYNCWFWYKAWKVLLQYTENSNKTQSFQQNLRYLNVVMLIQALCLGLWATIGLIWSVGWISGLDLQGLSDKLTDVVWGVFSLLTYILGYFAMNQPEIFKLAKVTPKYKDSSLTAAEMKRYKGRLQKAMEEDFVFMNPELTLGQLSEIVQTNTHTLSRVINEGYNKSFYDFINEYRVHEFNRVVLSGESPNETFLAIALQVGFNSKTTFNRAYKKVTGTTPRAYLKEQQSKEVA